MPTSPISEDTDLRRLVLELCTGDCVSTRTSYAEDPPAKNLARTKADEML